MKRRLVILILLMLASAPVCFANSMIHDDGEREIKVDKPFTRIISLYGAHTENLMALGLSKEIIGVTHGEDDVPGLENKKEFSYHDGPEKYLAEKPDLVLIRPMIDRGYARLVSRLEQSGITVLSFQPGSIDAMYEYWRDLGILTGKVTEAETMIADFKASVAEIHEKTKTITSPKHVYFEAMHRQMKTFSKDSMAMFCLETAGGINVATDAEPSHGTNIGIYGKERILSHAQDIDVFLVQVGRMNQADLSTIVNEPGFDIIKAVRDKQIYFIDEMRVSRPTARLIEGIRQIGAALYPEIFKDERRKIKEEHPTLNAQRPTSNGDDSDGGCWRMKAEIGMEKMNVQRRMSRIGGWKEHERSNTSLNDILDLRLNRRCAPIERWTLSVGRWTFNKTFHTSGDAP